VGHCVGESRHTPIMPRVQASIHCLATSGGAHSVAVRTDDLTLGDLCE
jgi:hypothetical protein